MVGTHREQCLGMLLVADATAGPFWCLVPQGGGGDKASSGPGIPSLIWVPAVPLECVPPSIRTPWEGLPPPWPHTAHSQDGDSGPGCSRLSCGSGLAMPHTAALECLQQEP